MAKNKKAKEPTLKDAIKAINKMNREILRLYKRVDALRKRVEEGPTNDNVELW